MFLNSFLPKEIILEGDILIGGNLIITSKKIIIGENIKVGGNVFISSSKPVENKENIISFGKKEFKNIKIL